MTELRDTVVVGASSGGIRALRELLSQLRPDLPASVLIVQHQGAGPGRLAEVLRSAARLPVTRVDHRQELLAGHVYVAPPERHMVVQGAHVLVTRGPRENRARPAINPLFRSAAAERGSRVIGVLLTGLLDDGVAGLDAVKRCGGATVVQDPQDAEFPEMPLAALEAVSIDHVVPLSAMGELLVELTGQAAPPVEIPPDVLVEARLNGPGRSEASDLEVIGEQVPLACPECGGPLWQVGAGGAATYRCHVGHALSARALLESQSDEIERSLWVAVRTLAERAASLDRLATQAERRASRLAVEFRRRATEALTHSEQARQFLVSLRGARPPEKQPWPDDEGGGA